MTSPRSLLTAWDIHAKKEFGQNFLSDPSTAEMIVTRAKLSREDSVVEIGPGLGALTIPSAKAAKKVFAIEKDRQIIPLLNAELLAAGVSNVDIINQNVMKVDLHQLVENEKEKIIVMGNLPYNISSQILVKLVQARGYVKKAVFMFQKELARRIASSPGTGDYGRLSVMMQYCADIKTIAEVKAHLFYPKPKVDSEVIEIEFHEKPLYKARNEEFLFSVVKAAFGKRRKTLKNAISSSELNVDAQTTLSALEQSGIDPKRRAETLDIKEFVTLSDNLLSLIRQ